MNIYSENDSVFFECEGEKYTLTSHPYEPCLYVSVDGKTIKTIHNAFEVHQLVQAFANGEMVAAPDGRQHDKQSFCQALEAALDYDKPECNFTFAADLSRMEKKCPHDFITDGILNYGVDVGRFVFEQEGVTVYAVSDLPHISASDCFTLYQISSADYNRLLKLSCPDRIPDDPVLSSVVEKCRKCFLCGESVYQPRYYFRLFNADKKLTVSNKPKPAVMNFCTNCGTKNQGDKYCRNCGTKLIKKETTKKDDGADAVDNNHYSKKIPRLIESGNYMGVTAYIYEYADGTVVAATQCSERILAYSIAEFYTIPRSKLELMIYSSEMNVAR